MVKITEFHEHSEGKVSSQRVKARKCWPQHKTDPDHALACEAFVQYKTPTIPTLPRGAYPWIITVIDIEVVYFTPLPCGAAHWTVYERWPVKGTKTDLDPRVTSAPYGPWCPPAGEPWPCAMQVTHQTTATLKALSYPPNQEAGGSVHVYGASGFARDANGQPMENPDGSLVVDDSVPPDELAGYKNDAASPPMTNGNGPIQVVFTLEWFPVDCNRWTGPTVVPANPHDGQQFARVDGVGGSGVATLSSAMQLASMQSVLGAQGMRPSIAAPSPAIPAAGILAGGMGWPTFGFGVPISGERRPSAFTGGGAETAYRGQEGRIVAAPSSHE